MTVATVNIITVILYMDLNELITLIKDNVN